MAHTSVTTAIIFAGGYGTRMLPVTAGVQKELLPILDRPVIDYTVADCVRAGIKRIIIVVRAGSHAIQDYYVGQPSLQYHLERFGKHDALKLLAKVHDQATFEFVEQPAEAGYGTAIPLRIVKPHLDANESVVVCGSDDFVYHPDGVSEVANMIEILKSSRAVGVIAGLVRPADQLHRYGILNAQHTDRGEMLSGLVEKPAPGTAPTNLANMGKYIMTPTMLAYVDHIQADPKSGEFLLTDAILSCANDHPVAVYRSTTGHYLDAGNLSGWLEANLVLAQANPDLRAVVEQKTKKSS